MAVVTRRTVMSLFSDTDDIYSHQVRIVLAEKGVNVEIHTVDTNEANEANEGLLDVNPYGSTPTLVDRELVLYHPHIIMEYLDERFPHPPLLPVYPVARAEARKMMYRIENDWYSLLKVIVRGPQKETARARKQLVDSLIAIEPIFSDKPYFLNDEFSLLDCCVAPLLWRLIQLKIELPYTTIAIEDYMRRVFARESFQQSLSEIEREVETV
jgi:stringent starvation protein A